MAVPGGSLTAVKVAAAVPLSPAVHVPGVSAVRDSHICCLTVAHGGRGAGGPSQELPGVRRGVEAGSEGDGAEVQLLSEADLVSLAGEHLTVGEVEALNVPKYPGVILETVRGGSVVFDNILQNISLLCVKLTSRGLSRRAV